jgi:ABC-2 type transport system permease protein
MCFCNKRAARCGKERSDTMNLFTETWLLFTRHLKKTAREPMWFFIGMMQPALYLLLYMPLLKNMPDEKGLARTMEATVLDFTPGMLIVLAMGGLFAGFSFIDEIRIGIIARWLVTPASRMSIIASLIANQLVTLVLQCAILLIVAYFFGLQVPIDGLALAMVLVLMIGISMSAASYAISLTVQDEGALASITNTFYLPVMLLSGILIRIDAKAPEWLQTAALFNPFYYVVEGSRAMFEGRPEDPMVWKGFLVMVIFTTFMYWLALKALQRMRA